MTLTAVDCQAFAGGFSLGMVQAGFELVAKREHEAGFGAKAALANRRLLGDFLYQSGPAASWSPTPANVVFGNPPCSGWSLGSLVEFRGINSPVNGCMWDLVRYAARCQPQVVAFESVQGAYSSGRPLMQALRTELEELTGDTWTLSHVKHNAYAFGNVQWRPRYFWVAVRGDKPLGVDPTVSDFGQGVWSAISDLENLPLSWESQPLPLAGWTAPRVPEIQPEPVSLGFVDGHATNEVDGALWKRVVATLDAGWPHGVAIETALRLIYERDGRLPEPWTETDVTRLKAKEWRNNFFPIERAVPGLPARVVHGTSTRTIVHPTQHRLVTHREVARIMGFPDTWTCLPWAAESGGAAAWGKGITVQCGRWLGLQIKAHLDGETEQHIGVPVGEREYLINIEPRTKRATKKQKQKETVQ